MAVPWRWRGWSRGGRSDSARMTASRSDVLVLQSHRLPLPAAWLVPCLASVRAWTAP